MVGGWFDRLRFLLGAPPSREVWSALLGHMERAPVGEQAVGLGYAWQHLQAWPGELCCTPQAWLKAGLRGEELPVAWLLCRRWSIQGLEFKAQDMGALLERSEALAQRMGAWWRVEEIALTLGQHYRQPAQGLLKHRLVRETLRRLELWAYGMRLDDAVMVEALSALQALRALRVGHAEVSLGALSGTAWWSGLEQLELVGVVVAALGDAQRRNGLPPLRELSLAVGAPGTPQLRALHDVEPSLEALRLRENHLDDADLEALTEGPGWRRLRTLEIVGNNLGDEGAQRLARRAKLPALETLSLASNGLSAEGARALVEAAGAPERLGRLHALDLSGNPLEDSGVAALAAAPALRALETLSLRDAHIAPGGTAALLDGAWGERVERLDLSANPRLDLGALAQRGADALPSLRTLTLRGMGLGAAQAQALAASDLLAQLEHLDLAFNDLDETGAQTLLAAAAQHPRLTLWLFGNPKVRPWTMEQAARLRARDDDDAEEEQEEEDDEA